LSSQPFFTIGVPTYNRSGLLRETIDSILAQDFSDFEVIVGNDYTSEILSGEMLGITDPRIRFVNHPVNLREVGNMNALLELADGRYFTWLFDDDLFESGYLQTAHKTLIQTGFPQALFSSYHVIDDNQKVLNSAPATGKLKQFSGVTFLTEYCAERLAIISTSGFFDTVALREKVGRVEELCDSAIGLYCEYLFLVRCAALHKIVYLDTPFVIFRAHVSSWGESNTELDKYRSAGQNLLRRCTEVLCRIDLSDTATPILLGLAKIHLISYATKLVAYETNMGGSKYHALRQFNREADIIRTECKSQSGSWRLAEAFRFLLIQLYCCRFILGKFRAQQ
jgi:glycosyltransferase involved in cell wall biosynthesis